MTNYSIVPPRRVKDPRQLLYHFPSLPAQRYAQLVAAFHNDQMLRLAEQMANNLGFLLVPASCLHWKKKSEIATERKVMIGRTVYYMLKKEELSRRAFQKYLEVVRELSTEQDAG